MYSMKYYLIPIPTTYVLKSTKMFFFFGGAVRHKTGVCAVCTFIGLNYSFKEKAVTL